MRLEKKVRLNKHAVEHFSKGSFRERLKDYSGALREYEEAINICPTFAEAYYKRGSIKSKFGNHPDAVRDYDLAIEIILNIY